MCGDTICNDTTELSVIESKNILSAVFVVSALIPQEGSIQSRKPVKPNEVLEQLEKDNYYVSLPARHLWKSIGWEQKISSER